MGNRISTNHHVNHNDNKNDNNNNNENKCLICWEKIEYIELVRCGRCNIQLHTYCEETYRTTKNTKNYCKCPHCQGIGTLCT